MRTFYDRTAEYKRNFSQTPWVGIHVIAVEWAQNVIGRTSQIPSTPRAERDSKSPYKFGAGRNCSQFGNWEQNCGQLTHGTEKPLSNSLTRNCLPGFS